MVDLMSQKMITNEINPRIDATIMKEKSHVVEVVNRQMIILSG